MSKKENYEANSLFNLQTFKIIVCIVVPLIIFIFPSPEGLDPAAWKLFALYIAAILGIMLRPVAEPVVFFVVISLGGVVLKSLGTVLGGYANTTVWLVFSAFMIGQAFIETGLGSRIAYILIGRFGRTTLGLGYVAAFTDLILSPAIPSNTARSGGIVYPIFRSIAATMGSVAGKTAKKMGSYITLLMYFISLTTGSIFLTALATNPLVVAFAKDIFNFDITWFDWFKTAVVPGLVILMVIPYVVYKIYPPEIKTLDNKNISEKGLQDLGPITKKEKILAILFILALLGWGTGNIIKVDSTSVSITFITASLVTGVVTWDNLLSAKGAWNTLIWYGGILGLASGLTKLDFFNWLGAVITSKINFVGYNSFVVLAGLLFISLIVRYFFASQAAYVSTFIPLLFTIGLVAEVPTLLLVYLLGITTSFGSMLTHYANAAGPVFFGTGYVDQVTWWRIGAIIALMSIIVIVVIGLPYWKLLGIW